MKMHELWTTKKLFWWIFNELLMTGTAGMKEANLDKLMDK